MNALIAQQVIIHSGPEQFGWGPFLVSVVALVGTLVLVVLVVAQVHRRRSWDHAERMRMLEMGFAPQHRDRSLWPKAWVCAAIGAGVPLVAFAFTFFAYANRHGASDGIWVVPAVVSGLSVVGASLLAAHLFGTPTHQGATPADPDAARDKGAALDPDAYDVAGRRG